MCLSFCGRAWEGVGGREDYVGVLARGQDGYI